MNLSCIIIDDEPDAVNLVELLIKQKHDLVTEGEML